GRGNAARHLVVLFQYRRNCARRQYGLAACSGLSRPLRAAGLCGSWLQEEQRVLGIVGRKHDEGVEIDTGNERQVIAAPKRDLHVLRGRLQRELSEIESISSASEAAIRFTTARAVEVG